MKLLRRNRFPQLRHQFKSEGHGQIQHRLRLPVLRRRSSEMVGPVRCVRRVDATRWKLCTRYSRKIRGCEAYTRWKQLMHATFPRTHATHTRNTQWEACIESTRRMAHTKRGGRARGNKARAHHAQMWGGHAHRAPQRDTWDG